jgi:type I restriction enzyme, S subunit
MNVDGWRNLEIGAISTVVTGKTPSTKNDGFWNGDVPFITPPDLRGGRVRRAQRTITSAGLAEVNAIPRNAVMVCCIGSIGLTGICDADGAATNQQINSVIVDESQVDAHFCHYAVIHNRAAIEGAARITTVPILNKSNFSRIRIWLPPLQEQRQIAGVLSTVQRAIERQERLSALTAELKKALMHKLFTEGTSGEPLKQTDIGPVPQSWSVKELQEVSEPPQYGFTASAASAGNAQLLRITDIREAGVNWSTVPYCECAQEELVKYRLFSRDLVFARIGATTGKNFLVVDPPTNAVFASYLIRVRPKAALSPRFLAYFCQTAPYWHQIAASKGNNLKGGFNSSLLRRMLIPLPPDLEEQERIGAALAALDRKIDIARRTSVVLNAGFRTLLHQLMNAEIRVYDLDLSALEEAAQEPAGAE